MHTHERRTKRRCETTTFSVESALPYTHTFGVVIIASSSCSPLSSTPPPVTSGSSMTTWDRYCPDACSSVRRDARRTSLFLDEIFGICFGIFAVTKLSAGSIISRVQAAHHVRAQLLTLRPYSLLDLHSQVQLPEGPRVVEIEGRRPAECAGPIPRI